MWCTDVYCDVLMCNVMCVVWCTDVCPVLMICVLQWVLYVAPSTWIPAWRDPMIAVVVVVSFILALFLFILLLSRWVGRGT